MELNPVNLILAMLATYRLTELLTFDFGPADIFLRLREWAGVYDLGQDGRPIKFLGKLLGCAFCTGLYVAAALTLIFPLTVKSIIIWLGIAGGQALIQTIGGRHE